VGVPRFRPRRRDPRPRRGGEEELRSHHEKGFFGLGCWDAVFVVAAVFSFSAVAAVAALWKRRVLSFWRAYGVGGKAPRLSMPFGVPRLLVAIVGSPPLAAVALVFLAIVAPPPPVPLVVVGVAASFADGI